MAILKTFFSNTYFIWFFSRIPIIYAFLYAIILQFDLHSISTLIVTVIFTSYILSILYLLIIDVLGKKPLNAAKKIVGVISILIGCIQVCAILYTYKNKTVLNNIGYLITPFWIILYGLWELKKELRIPKTEAAEHNQN